MLPGPGALHAQGSGPPMLSASPDPRQPPRTRLGESWPGPGRHSGHHKAQSSSRSQDPLFHLVGRSGLALVTESSSLPLSPGKGRFHVQGGLGKFPSYC